MICAHVHASVSTCPRVHVSTRTSKSTGGNADTDASHLIFNICAARACRTHAANPRTKSLDFRRFDSSIFYYYYCYYYYYNYYLIYSWRISPEQIGLPQALDSGFLVLWTLSMCICIHILFNMYYLTYIYIYIYICICIYLGLANKRK